MGGTRKSLKKWVKSLPKSKMAFPGRFDERLRYLMWRLYAPAHPFLRGALAFAGVEVYPGRGRYLIGRIAPEHSLADFVNHLIGLGFGNHYVAWRHEGELLGLRLVKDFKYQYHLRIFEDGEVRGHYEYTPECYPVKHARQKDMERRREDFLEFLQGWIVPQHEEALAR